MINNKLSKSDILLLSHNISPALKGYERYYNKH